MNELEERAKRLTPREWRVVALILEGVPASQACESLGIAPGTFESHKQAIRRKLGLPRGERMEKHLQPLAGSMPDEAQAAPVRAVPAPPPDDDRRVRLLYRMTIDELMEVAGSAELRAGLLEQTIKRMSSDDVDSARKEIDDLRAAAVLVRETAKQLLDRARNPV